MIELTGNLMGGMITMIGHVFNTVLGLYGRKYSKEWDRILNNIIDEGVINEIGTCTLKIKYKQS